MIEFTGKDFNFEFLSEKANETIARVANEKIRNLNPIISDVFRFVNQSHHIDGCEFRYQKDCNCGKFRIIKEIRKICSE